ncbi:1-deoxy-D-xylulose-5-phosphate reductoisomerase [uncultured Desulfuromonas sp.]|uniref:1-deoxy-D-xylulose-5-phosphate reductoisomerase n=1 Tax=uncultured Desulfuromonas sp. TaxID=181013 RepID=UPI002AAAFF7F|nr:1-deoxy-D-xylulose-5-phosphate reductoisomerase [uncultured Desulfuromonas sp.]
MKSISVLGSTGSIGVSTLDVVAEFPEKFRVVALSAGRQIELLADQIRRFKPEVVSVADPADRPRLQALVQDCSVDIVSGVDGAVSCATHPQAQMVVSAIVGAAGLLPTMAAIEAGKDIALANKETLVTAGALIMDAVRHHEVNLLPVDSEHSAIYQSLCGHQYSDVRRLILTASGGPFREFSRDQLEHVTLEQALNHPNWSMGAKITIDSATMMNKGLEVIEAYWLFNIPAERIDVHIHPQSIVHSMVEYIDGSVVAQLGIPDMKTPIAYALAWPNRLPLSQPALDLCQWADLSFSRPDLELFPCLKLAYEALAEGGSAPIVLNAANEVAVEEFLKQNIQYLDISSVIRQVLDRYRNESIHSIDDVLHCDDRARHITRELIAQGR